MSLINDMLQDLEARDAPAPAHAVPRPRRGRAVNWLLPVLGALALAAVALLAVWLLRDVPAVVGTAPAPDPLAAAGAVPRPRSNPNPSPTDSAPTTETASVVAPEPATPTVGAVSRPRPNPNPSPTDPVPATETASETAPDPAATTVAAVSRPQSNTNPSQTDTAPTTETASVVAPEPTTTPVAAVSRPRSDPNPSPTDSTPSTQQSNTAIVVRPAGRTRDAAAEGLDSARRALGRGQTGVAISRLEQLLDQHPDASEIRILMARTLLATNRSQRAERLLSEGLTRDGGNHELAFWLARSQLQQNRTGPALATLERHAPTVEAAPGYHLLLAATLRQLGRHEDAFEHYRTITDESPDNTRAWLGRALSAEALGRTDAARNAYTRVLEGGEAEASRLARQRLNALGPDVPRN